MERNRCWLSSTIAEAASAGGNSRTGTSTSFFFHVVSLLPPLSVIFQGKGKKHLVFQFFRVVFTVINTNSMVLPCGDRDQQQLFFISVLFLICSFPVVG
jgi:hypothetical protein